MSADARLLSVRQVDYWAACEWAPYVKRGPQGSLYNIQRLTTYQRITITVYHHMRARQRMRFLGYITEV